MLVAKVEVVEGLYVLSSREIVIANTLGISRWEKDVAQRAEEGL
jgi:hypothetical protein